MIRFNVGDRVHLKQDLVIGKQYNNISFSLDMLKYVGEIATVELVVYGGLYILKDIPCVFGHDMLEKIESEDIVMNARQILNIYFKRKEEKLIDDMFTEKTKIRENDDIHKLLEDTENQINVMLDRNEKNRYVMAKLIFLPETEEKLQKLQEKYDLDLAKLHQTREEIEAQLALIPYNEDSYCDTIELLQLYEVLDEKGKINA